MLNRLKSIQIDAGLLFATAYLIKMLVVTASLADAIIMTATLAVIGVLKYQKQAHRLNYKLFLKSCPPKSNPSKHLQDEILKLKSDMSKLMINKSVETNNKRRF